MNKLVIALLLATVQGTQLNRMKVDGVNLDIDEEPDLKDPVDTKKEFKLDQANLQSAVDEFASAQEKMDMGGLAKDLAIGLVEDIKQKLVEVDQHITFDMDPKNFVEQEYTDDKDSLVQKQSTGMFEETSSSFQVQDRAKVMQKMIPNLIEMERKLDTLPDGSFTDEKLDSVFAHIDPLAPADKIEPKAKSKKASKSLKKVVKKSKK